jgi:uncharacterized lipoprotein YddW (UPF0748 family)
VKRSLTFFATLVVSILVLGTVPKTASRGTVPKVVPRGTVPTTSKGTVPKVVPRGTVPTTSRGTVPKVVVVQAKVACDVADRAYSASLARHVMRWLEDGGVKADLVEDGSLVRDLTGRRLAYLVVCQKPTAAQMKALAVFRAKGGKIAVLQSYSPELADFMRVTRPSVSPNRDGAVVAVPVNGGWWVGNMFASAADEEAKTRLVCSIAGMASPGAWNASAWEARRRVREAAARAKAAAQVPRKGEIHAVWDHTGLGLYPGDWPRTMRLLRDGGITDLFVNVAGAGFAHYNSRILPISDECRARGDQLAACLAAARGTGVRVHAWVMCFSAARAVPGRLDALAKKGWRLKDASGRLTEYIDPSNAAARWHILSAIGEIADGYQVAGVHLDFVRWYEGAAKPSNAARKVETFVEAARGRVRSARPGAWLTAAVFASHPACVASVGQDWEGWIEKGLVDYAVPMNYTADSTKYAVFMARQGRSPAVARRVIGGIGVTASESVLSPEQVIDQVVAARRAGLAGVALFDLDRTLALRVLPLLRLGLFR